MIEDRFGHRVRGSRVADIALKRQAVRAKLADLIGYVVQGFRGSRTDRHRGSRARDGHGDDPADALVPTGDDRDLSLQCERHGAAVPPAKRKRISTCMGYYVHRHLAMSIPIYRWLIVFEGCS